MFVVHGVLAPFPSASVTVPHSDLGETDVFQLVLAVAFVDGALGVIKPVEELMTTTIVLLLVANTGDPVICRDSVLPNAGYGFKHTRFVSVDAGAIIGV